MNVTEKFLNSLNKKITMKKIILFATLLSSVFITKADDILTLSNCQQFYGKAVHKGNCKVIFQYEKQTYDIPATDIYSLQFGNLQDSVYKRYEADSTADKCLQGTADATAFHGKVFEHIALGFLFGCCGVAGSALSEPSPYKDPQAMAMSKNKNKFNNSSYLECYKRKAKNMNIGNAFLGWGLFLAIYIPIKLSQTTK